MPTSQQPWMKLRQRCGNAALLVVAVCLCSTCNRVSPQSILGSSTHGCILSVTALVTLRGSLLS